MCDVDAMVEVTALVTTLHGKYVVVELRQVLFKCYLNKYLDVGIDRKSLGNISAHKRSLLVYVLMLNVLVLNVQLSI